MTQVFYKEFLDMNIWKLFRKKEALKMAAKTIDNLNNIYKDIGNHNQDTYGFFVSDPIQRKRNIENYRKEYLRSREEQARNEGSPILQQ